MTDPGFDFPDLFVYSLTILHDYLDTIVKRCQFLSKNYMEFTQFQDKAHVSSSPTVVSCFAHIASENSMLKKQQEEEEKANSSEFTHIEFFSWTCKPCAVTRLE